MNESTPAIKDYATRTADGKYVVGGLKYDRPFRIRRLGHFGFNVAQYDEAVRFYTDVLGFDISDARSYAERLKPEQLAELEKRGGKPHGCFTRYGTDHHALVLFNKQYREIADPPGRWRPGVTVNQITWQVGSLGEIGDAIKYFQRENVPILRSGRDMPGSNWHTYLHDPDGNTNELFWGMEQIGWDGHSKPKAIYYRAFQKAPELPQMSEFDEVQQALAKGMDITQGYRFTEKPECRFDVQGQSLARPFKVVRLGPVRLFVADLEQARDFYARKMGFVLTEETTWKGHRCLFLRCSNEHTAVALYPLALREELAKYGLSTHTTSFSLGMQVANYEQLRAARDFLKDAKVKTIDLPLELFPGIDYMINAQDPDGHLIQLYYYMEQIGWDGRPRTASERRKVEAGVWPEALDPMSDSMMGEPYLGPWG
ncbi:MAG TPA: VOC family protein [Alphaproteobacteria bacterium]|jgi:catechol 2,3-dioxygenase-like lactoylglutathione lyase family enzyme|nr:VOC family protein [Alphaproteobacteria bacterium]